MKKIAIILALMLILGAVFISGCTTSNTSNNSGQNGSSGNSGQSGSSGSSGQQSGPKIPGYNTAQIISIGSVK